jgi:hypothetical protein
MDATLLGAIVGGLLATVAAWFGSSAANRHQSWQWQLDLAVRLDTEMLSALQELQRAVFDNATTDMEHKRKSFPDEATRWNASQFALLLRGSRERTALLRDLDLEIDRMASLSKERVFDREAFRAERIHLGRLMATYIEQSRKHYDLPPLKLDTVWTWDVSPGSGNRP